MKKILCLIDSLGSGGAQRQIVGLAYLLRENGYDVHLACYHPIYFYEDWVISHHIPLIKLLPKHDKISKYLTIRKLQKRECFNWIIAYIDGPTVISALLKCLLGGFNLIVSERNVTQRISKVERIKFFFYRFADFIVPNSYSQQRFIETNYPQLAKKTVTITNFVNTDEFVPMDEIPMKNNIIKVLVVGRINPQKNIKRFLQALKVVERKHLPLSVKWIGDVDDMNIAYNKECLNLVHELRLEAMIQFYPATRTIIKEYQQCDVFCLPSLFEGFPNVVCEAMSCGKPIICSHVCDNPYIVQEGINGFLFNPLSIDDIYKSLERFCQMDWEQRTQMAQNSRSIAIDLFSEKAFISKYIHLIEK